jgi:uncharacterized RDD family membrane protein YckC
MEYSNLHLAGQGVRLINSIVDMISIFILWIILSLVLVLRGLDQVYTDESGEQFLITPMIILLPTFWTYYILTEFLFQRTLGKVLTKTMVITKNGSRPTFGQILGRTFSRSIPFEYLSYLVTTIGIHDRISGTRVVKVY